MLLTNEAHFHGHTSLYGASAFLVENKHGVILAATARHLIGSAGGVEPEIELARFNDVLDRWTLSVRNDDPDKYMSIESATPIGATNSNLDWLILRLANDSTRLAEPLQMREAPVKIGETVYLVGVPYSDGEHTQNIYVGKVTERRSKDWFRYTINPAADIRGFSGAPILDKDGLVVGVMTVWFHALKNGDLYLEAGGEDIASIATEINAIE